MTDYDSRKPTDNHDLHHDPDYSGRIAHWVYTVFFSLLFVVLDFVFLWPENHFLALLALAAGISVVALYETWRVGRIVWGRSAAVILFVMVGVIDQYTATPNEVVPPKPERLFVVLTADYAHQTVNTTTQMAYQYIGHKTVENVVISPIHWFIYVSITNLYDYPIRITGFHLYLNPYETQRPKPSNGNQNYPLPELCDALRQGGVILNTYDGLTEVGAFSVKDKTLQEAVLGRMIAPHDTVSGWTAWECPGSKCDGPVFMAAVVVAGQSLPELVHPQVEAIGMAPFQEMQLRQEGWDVLSDHSVIRIGSSCDPQANPVPLRPDQK